ncbi:MAG: tryptophan halogenase family protein, partial [Pseudomonadota bacterium]
MPEGASTPLRVIILGGGTAGWMAANLFARAWSRGEAQVTLIESPDIATVGVGEGSTPTLKRFFELLDVPEREWMPRCKATYKLNIRFDGWSPASGHDGYSHPFVTQIDTLTQHAFMTNCRTRRLGLDVHTAPADFFLNGVLARQGKGPQAAPTFPFVMDYGYHFDAGELGRFLADVAISRGVQHLQRRVTKVEQHHGGDLAAVVDDGGERHEADFFVDCTGFAGVLIGKTLDVRWRSFGDNLFNDAAVVLPTPMDRAPPVETVSVALSNGWCWRIPLTHRFGNGYVYSSHFIDGDAAEAELREFLGMRDSDEPARHLKMRVGQREHHWERNCLALGLSQGFIEPLEATALLLVQVSIELFIRRFQLGAFEEEDRVAYNTAVHDRFERVRDYIVAHYKLNTRDDSAYWRANRDNMVLSDSLRHLLDVWYRRQDLSQEIQRQRLESHFGTLSWHCLLSGYGAYPALAPEQPGAG